MKSAPETPYCRLATRHWFTYYGEPGTSAPSCRHCGVMNPNYDPDRDPHQDKEPRIVCPEHRMPDCSPLLNGCSKVIQAHRQIAEKRGR